MYLNDAGIDARDHISPRRPKFVDLRFEAIVRRFQASDEDHRHSETSHDRQQHPHDKRQRQYRVEEPG